jgi:hypothetical protein
VTGTGTGAGDRSGGGRVLRNGDVGHLSGRCDDHRNVDATFRQRRRTELDGRYDSQVGFSIRPGGRRRRRDSNPEVLRMKRRKKTPN